ncbi:MAG: threonine/serine exporter family protein [Lachnospiraceae bacterium]|nr:threonine/serine exporter family protein [Lachnospiraceae bacterium]
MNYDKILQEILNIGDLLLQTGAENFRTEDSLYRMCESYGFVKSDVHVIPSNIQATIETKDGQIFTQIRHVRRTGIDFTKLDHLNNLCRYVCQNTPDEKELRSLREKIENEKPQALSTTAIAAVLGGGSFTVFFGGGAYDAILGGFLSAFIAVGGYYLGKKESNRFIYNLILAAACQFVILLLTPLCPGSHAESVTVGIAMMLISALSTTNGIRDMLQRDILAGLQNILGSILGAAGIACGIAVSMLLLHGQDHSMMIVPGLALQLISCTLGCIGFAMWFHVSGMPLYYNGIGAFFTWLIYALMHYQWAVDNFFSTLVAACFVAAFAYVMARRNKMPSTIFLTSAVMPLIPGSNLYYMMYAVTRSDSALLKSETVTLLETCLAIALGFLVFDAVMRYTSDIPKNSIFAK